ncbi:hypothetical protein MYX07_05490 [Patescibacteria group bacterium AH-259-L07]|nr:hypothetical protein [Patescibacteria group bacterium AH-259-L07]
METLQIRLPEKQLQDIDLQVKKGVFKSRSDAVRSALERLRFLAFMDAFRDVIEKENVNKKDLLKELQNARRELYRQYL